MATRWGKSGNSVRLYFGGLQNHWKWQPTPVFLPRESQGQRSLVGCHLWGHTESDFAAAAAKSLQMVIAAMKLKDAYSLEGKL